MESGLDRLPGHAYAPGMEPGWWENFVVVTSGSSDSLVGLPMIGLLTIAIMLLAARLLGVTGRMKAQRQSRRHKGAAESAALRERPDMTTVLTKTIMDPNFARELRHTRMKPKDGTSEV